MHNVFPHPLFFGKTKIHRPTSFYAGFSCTNGASLLINKCLLMRLASLVNGGVKESWNARQLDDQSYSRGFLHGQRSQSAGCLTSSQTSFLSDLPCLRQTAALLIVKPSL
jgi:hypothetical protein